MTEKPVTPRPTPETLTVLYDGACPLCRREIAHVKGLAERTANSGLQFVDISDDPNKPPTPCSPTRSTHPLDAACNATTANAIAVYSTAEREMLLARFHVQKADGSRISGAAAFVSMWERLPGWRWLARFARRRCLRPGWGFALRQKPKSR